MNVETTQNEMRGGIGNKVCYTIKTDRNLTLTVDTPVFQNDYLEMIIGGEHETGVTAEVQSGGTVKVTDNLGKKEIQLPADKNTVKSIILEDVNGNQESITVASGKGEVPAGFKADEGAELQYFYKKEIKDATKFTIDAAKFAGKVKITFRTIAYSVETETVYSDIWWEFPSVSSNGSLDLTMTAGEALVPSMTFTATAPRGVSALGFKYEQLRA